ncbi:PilZ domain-containing protein [Vibrio rhodolitus]|uniref:PilZ domain-containing protein n=1 Tax=Vibrio rhodolitus TaxID=2231649 RepID=UPI000E0A7842|nr:PilZ domain-containing protein [Vibrio rhodolitus]
MPNNNVELLIPFLAPGLKFSVKLEFGSMDSFSFNCDYIGCKLGQYLILEFPKKVQEALVMRQVNNAEVIVRGITQSKLGHIIAFKSSILGSINSPTGLLFLRMPKHFASKPIRSHERYPLDLEVTIKANTVSYEATMLDFSLNGCACFIKGENSLEKSSLIEIESELSAFLPSNLACTVVSIEKQKLGHRFGIKFNQTIEMNAELKQLLLEKTFIATPL